MYLAADKRRREVGPKETFSCLVAPTGCAKPVPDKGGERQSESCSVSLARRGRWRKISFLLSLSSLNGSKVMSVF